MIEHPAFPIEPWRLRETHLHRQLLAQTESLFALSNGHIGLRGNLDEGEPHGLPGTYLNGVYELRPLPYAEAGFGYPESGQSIINVTNGKLIRLLVDDEPFDVRYGRLRAHERVLDLRAGTLQRDSEWVTPAGRTVRVSSTRLVSFTQRAVAAICYQVSAVDQPVDVVLQSELVANESLPAASGDPRVAAVLESPLQAEMHDADACWAVLVHRTKRSRLRVGAAMDHEVDSLAEAQTTTDLREDLARFTVTASLRPQEHLRVVKYLAYGWSAQRSLPAVRDQVAAALTAARRTGWESLLAEQRGYLDEFWDRADVQLDGDPQVQQAVRFGLFHVLQAGARAEGRAIPAKGLTGTGYDGHCFWDTETYVLPVLTHTAPAAAAHALRWRHSTLPLALSRARQLGHRGAAFPWRTIHGEECSAYWPAGTAAVHIAGDIADAVVRYVDATGDDAFERDVGLELLVQTARFWCSIGHRDADGRFRIDGVTGPDEYSALADNNVYTNLVAGHNLRSAAAAAARHPQQAAQLGVREGETAEWAAAAAAMYLPWDDALGVHPQADGYTTHQVWDFARTGPEQYPLMLHFPYFDLYRKQVVKQADLVLAMHRHPDAFTAEQKARNFDYYERITVRDSSLSACTQAILAAEVGHLELAHDYLAEAALMDLDDLEHNTRDGLHMASLAGAWLALIAGLGGAREVNGELRFAPRLPPAISRLAFTVFRRRCRLRVQVGRDTTTYTLLGDHEVTVLHDGSPVRLVPGEPQELANPAVPQRTAPDQPPGRAPADRRRQLAGNTG